MAESVNLLAGSKTQANPESTVGVLNLSQSASPRVLVTPTTDLGAVLSATRSTELGGSASVSSGASVAQLALKHRQNKSQAQRLVLFVGSHVPDSDSELERVGKRLKKQNVAVDVVSFGSDAPSNEPKLRSLVDAANNEDNSHLVSLETSSEALSDALLTTPIFADAQAAGGGSGFAAAAAAAAAASNQQQEGTNATDGMDIEGVDPNMDPQLAMALRASLQEERARQEQQTQQPSEQEGGENGASAAQEQQQQQQQQAQSNESMAAQQQAMNLDEDTLLQQALQMSVQESGGGGGASSVQQHEQQHEQQGSGGDTAMVDEDPDLAMALRMSREEEGGEQGNNNSNDGGQ
jgi:26S proteasome regulatory subunit N10